MQARARFLLFFVKKMKINLHNSKKSSTFARILKNKSDLTLIFHKGKDIYRLKTIESL